jgi:TonB family protein
MSYLMVLALVLGGQGSPAHTPARSARVNDYLVTVLRVWTIGKSTRFHSVVIEVRVKNVSRRVSRALFLLPWIKVKPEDEYPGQGCTPHLCGGRLKSAPDVYQMLPGEQSIGGYVFEDVRNGTVPVSLYFHDRSPFPAVSLAGLVREEAFRINPAGPGNPPAVTLFDVPMPSPPSEQVRGHTGGRIFRAWVDVSPPLPIYDPQPEYSEEAREAGIEGIDELSVVVLADGSVGDVQVIRPLGRGLDEEAVKTVRTWHFKPCMKDGKPVSCRVDIPVAFRLY